MNLKGQRRLAASIMKVGESRVWIDPEQLERVEGAITKDEVRRLIHERVIRIKPKQGVSKGRRRGRVKKARGPGSKEGSKGQGKKLWIQRIRAVRGRLRELKAKRMITRQVYRRLIPMAKGGMFRSRAHLNEYLQSHGLIRRR
ncbi:MAG: 50S ribosomal protein L19e [Candidatus Bathyarchaeia archaeon]